MSRKRSRDAEGPEGPEGLVAAPLGGTERRCLRPRTRAMARAAESSTTTRLSNEPAPAPDALAAVDALVAPAAVDAPVAPDALAVVDALVAPDAPAADALVPGAADDAAPALVPGAADALVPVPAPAPLTVESIPALLKDMELTYSSVLDLWFGVRDSFAVTIRTGGDSGERRLRRRTLPFPLMGVATAGNRVLFWGDKGFRVYDFTSEGEVIEHGLQALFVGGGLQGVSLSPDGFLAVCLRGILKVFHINDKNSDKIRGRVPWLGGPFSVGRGGWLVQADGTKIVGYDPTVRSNWTNIMAIDTRVLDVSFSPCGQIVGALTKRNDGFVRAMGLTPEWGRQAWGTRSFIADDDGPKKGAWESVRLGTSCSAFVAIPKTVKDLDGLIRTKVLIATPTLTNFALFDEASAAAASSSAASAASSSADFAVEGLEFQTFDGRERFPLTCLAANSRRNLAVTGSEGGSVIFWDLVTRRRLASALCHRSIVRDVALNSQGSLCASAGRGGVVVRDTRTFARVTALMEPHTRTVTSVNWNFLGTRLATCSPDTVCVWDTSTWRLVLAMPTAASASSSSSSSSSTLSFNPNAPSFVKFHPIDDDLLVVAVDKFIHVWRVSSNTLLHTIVCRGCVLRIEVARSLIMVAVWDSPLLVLNWDGERVGEMGRSRSAELVTSVAWDTAGKTLAVLHFNGLLMRWNTASDDLADWRVAAELPSLSSSNRALAVTEDGRVACGAPGPWHLRSIAISKPLSPPPVVVAADDDAEGPSDETGNCAICKSRDKDSVLVPCGHMGCHKCLTEWIHRKRECPMCRRPVFTIVKPFKDD